MTKTHKPGSGDVPKGLDNLDDVERTDSSRTPSGVTGSPPESSVAGLGSKETLRRLLDDDTLAFTEDDSRGSVRRIQPNPGGLKKGYDPYDSGMLLKKQWKKKKDLRALSKWIEQKKKLEEDR